MPQPAKLPTDGGTNKEIVRRWNAGETLTSIGSRWDVTGEAIRNRLNKLGVDTSRGRVKHDELLPWPAIRADHRTAPLGRLVMAYSRARQGREVNKSDAERLERFLSYLNGDNQWSTELSVHYDLASGWSLRPRRPGEGVLVG